MNATKRKMSPAVASVLVGAFAALILGAGMFLLVLPQRHKAASLAKEVESTQQQIAQARALAEQKPAQPIHVAQLFKLVKAMPDGLDMPGILLQLNQTASDSGIEFDSISPDVATTQGNFQVVPIALDFTGNFYDLNDFLFRLRNLVTVRGGELGATGRLFSVQTIEFGQGDGGFPNIHATLKVNAYVYGTSGAASSGTTPPPPSAATSTTTSTTTTTTPPPAETPPAVASGVAP